MVFIGGPTYTFGDTHAGFVPRCQDGGGRSRAQESAACREVEMMEDAQQVAVLDGAEIARRVEALLPEIEAGLTRSQRRAGCRGTSSMH